MNVWKQRLYFVERSPERVRFVVQLGSQFSEAGIALIKMRAERVAGPTHIDDACTHEVTADLRLRTLHQLRQHLGPRDGLAIVLEDDLDHPVDAHRRQYERAGRMAAALIGAWLDSPDATDDELVRRGWVD